MHEHLKINALEDFDGHVRESVPLVWEPEYVGSKLVAAFVTLDRLPRVRGPREPGGNWPGHCVELADQLAQSEIGADEKRIREYEQNRAVIRPTASEIAGMDEALEWLRELRRVDTGLALIASLWALHTARGRSIRKLCRARQWSPQMFYRKRAKALSHLAEWLKARAVPVT